jgi:hypothetical protein
LSRESQLLFLFIRFSFGFSAFSMDVAREKCVILGILDIHFNARLLANHFFMFFHPNSPFSQLAANKD